MHLGDFDAEFDHLPDNAVQLQDAAGGEAKKVKTEAGDSEWVGGEEFEVVSREEATAEEMFHEEEVSTLRRVHCRHVHSRCDRDPACVAQTMKNCFGLDLQRACRLWGVVSHLSSRAAYPLERAIGLR
jgi:hypothetical protein